MATTKKEGTAEVVETTEAKPRLSRLERLQQELAEAEAKARAKKEAAFEKAQQAETKAADALEKAYARHRAAAAETYELGLELGYFAPRSPVEQDEAAEQAEQPELPLEG